MDLLSLYVCPIVSLHCCPPWCGWSVSPGSCSSSHIHLRLQTFSAAPDHLPQLPGFSNSWFPVHRTGFCTLPLTPRVSLKTSLSFKIGSCCIDQSGLQFSLLHQPSKQHYRWVPLHVAQAALILILQYSNVVCSVLNLYPPCGWKLPLAQLLGRGCSQSVWTTRSPQLTLGCPSPFSSSLYRPFMGQRQCSNNQQRTLNVAVGLFYFA